jgi:integrase/recombinase XerC
VYFDPVSQQALKVYFIERKRILVQHENPDENAVFVNLRGKPLTPAGLRYIVARYSGMKGTCLPVTPHTFRHSFATTLLNNGADIRIVQELLGHTSIAATHRYWHTSTKRLFNVYMNAHPHAKEKDKEIQLLLPFDEEDDYF